MKVLVLLGLGALVLSCGGGSATTIPAAEACSQITTTACKKIYEATCTDLFSTSVQTALKSETECETTVIQGYCATSTTLCPAGYTYHGDKAQMCKDLISKQPCANFNGTLAIAAASGGADAAIASLQVSFPVCAQVCTTPGGGGGAGGV
jgi:hypothetical protein